jgi:hypothetical protein
MSSTGDNKKKRKRTSPFRIKVGCLVALRYRPRENRIQLEGPDGTIIDIGEDKDDGTDGGYEDPVSTAHFSEVWTDPVPGHDDGLALIGSRIRCFFPKTVLSEPYNATSQLLGGEVVNVVNYCEEQYSKRRDNFRNNRTSDGILVDLLVDNKDGKLQRTFPFLKRVDSVFTKEQLAAMSESERRNLKYEERIKGGPDKAIVRVRLSDEASSGISLKQSSKKNKDEASKLQAKWVIRKRVPAKIVRQVQKGENLDKESKTKTPDLPRDKDVKDSNEVSSDATLIARVPKNGKENDGHIDGSDTKDIQSSKMEDSTEEPPKKRQKAMVTNKDFSSSRYLGDGNDDIDQQEANWRWLAAKFNPYSILADRPLSIGLLGRLCYNFVGEVVRVQPELSPESKTLATVTLRCLVLPEHTVTGRLPHHRQYDVFETVDLSLEALECNGRESEIAFEMRDKLKTSSVSKPSNGKNQMQSCLLRVPVEDLVVVRRTILRDEGATAPVTPIEMTIRSSYSFHEDTYFSTKKLKEEGRDHSKNGTHSLMRCPRCREECFPTATVPGILHHLCHPCVRSLKKRGFESESKEQTMNRVLCDCCQCAVKGETSALSDLSDLLYESISKLGGTLQELGDFESQEDSGFIATRFVAKGMTTVDFTCDPFSVKFSLHSSSSKQLSKIPVRVPKKSKKLATPSINTSKQYKDGKKSQFRQADGRRVANPMKIASPKKDVFRPTSARTLTYDAKNRRFDASATDLYQWKLAHLSPVAQEYPELPRNHRVEANPHTEEMPENAGGKKLLGRAARANQRRLVRSIASMGVNVDTLAGREQQLRFDRSGIHDWGVFVDIDVREGDMIVEYRGEVIGNAMAEKREKEYHEAKLGSDYMFRIDELVRIAYKIR